MPLPASKPGGAAPLGAAATDLGLGSMLQDQVAGETEEQRKKRMREMQQQTMGPAAMSLFGTGGASGGGGLGY